MRFWNITEEDKNYQEAIARQAAEDSNAYGQGKMSIAARIKNAVALVSDIKTDSGSDMFMLSSYMAHSLEAVYRLIGSIDISDEAKITIANAIKNIENSPSRFAEAKKLQQIEARKKYIEDAAARKAELAKMEAEANNQVIENKASNFLDTTMLVNVQGSDDEPA